MAIPRTDNEFMIWLNNFAAAFPAHAAALGFTPAEVSRVHEQAAMVSYVVGDMLPAYRNALTTRTAYKTLMLNGSDEPDIGDPAPPAPPALAAPPAAVPPGILPRMRRLVQRIQVAPGYTESIGAELGITGEAAPASPSAPDRPTFTATSLPGSGVRLDFAKAGFEGVQVESRRAGEQGWRPLGIDHYSPYVDGRPPVEAGKPEVREYRLRYFSHDEPVGDWSDIVAAVTIP